LKTISLWQRLLFVSFAVVLMLFVTQAAKAQTNTGNVRGQVTDVQSSVISGADVVLINSATQLERETRTNDSGDFFFSAIGPGNYTLVISADGFKKVVHKDVHVDLQQTATVDEKLDVGVIGQTVSVSGATPLIDTATASGGQVISEQVIQELPNQGRNPFTVNKLDNNVTPVGDPRFVRYEDQNGTDSQSVAGAPLGANSYVVDGIPISTSTGGVTFVPAIEAVSEVKVQSNTYDAEIGRTGGGVFNTSLKSGSDTYHGELFGLTRQNALVANQWFYNHNGYIDSSGNSHPAPTPKPDFTTYQYAGAFGGPLPFGKRSRYLKNTFFWATEAGYRQAQPANTANYYVPSLAEREGDFSADGVTLYDPTQPFVVGKREAVLSGNKIPSTYINPIGQSIVNAFPKPGLDEGYDNGAPNYFGIADYKTRGDEYVIKLDHQFSSLWSTGASFVHLAIQEPNGAVLQTFAQANGVLTRYIDAVAVNNSIALNPTTLLTGGFGFSRYRSLVPQYSNGFNQANGFDGAGFPSGYVSQLQSKSYPTIAFSGVTGVAGLGAANTAQTDQIMYSYVVGITRIIGKQTWKAGYLYRGYDYTLSPETGGNGSFTFNGQYTSQTGAAVSNGPQAIADLLLGLPSSASVQINPSGLDQNLQYQAVYLQDDVRLTPKLTANLGLRYEYELGQREANNRFNVGFDSNATYQFPAASGDIAARGSIAFAGVDGYPTRAGNLSHTKFSPRVGLSYEAHPGTVIHAGYGVFYAAVPLLTTATTGFSQVTSYAPGNATGPVTAGPNSWFSNPYNAQLLQPSGTSLGNLTGAGGAVSVQSFGLRYPFVQQYSVNVQQQFGNSIVFKIGYVGAHARNLADPVNINQLPDSVLAQYAGGTTNLSSKIANPYYTPTTGSYPSTGTIAQKTVAHGQTLLPFPQFTSITESESVGHSLYNALDVKLEKRFSSGLAVLIAYTWSSNWDNLYSSPVAGLETLNPNAAAPQDNYNPEGEYSRAVNNIPNRLSAAVTYDLPIGKGKPILGGANRFVNAAIGDWILSDVTIVENGGALPIVQTNLSAGTFGTTGVGGSSQRPNLIPGVNPCYSGRPQDRLGGGNGARPYFNLSAFTPALPYTYGNAPRTLNCYGPGYTNSDISLSKNFKFTEKLNFKLDVQALNVFNTPEFSQPNVTLPIASGATITSASYTNPSTNATTGAITSQLGFSRIVQVGGRITF